MCRMFARQPAEHFASETRSIRIGGHCTSIRLENTFWTILEEIAASEGSSVAKFVTTLYDEALAYHGHIHNVASLLRCACMVYMANRSRPRGEEAAATCAVMIAAE